MISVGSNVVGKASFNLDRVGIVQATPMVNGKRLFDVIWEGQDGCTRCFKRCIRLGTAVNANQAPRIDNTRTARVLPAGGVPPDDSSGPSDDNSSEDSNSSISGDSELADNAGLPSDECVRRCHRHSQIFLRLHDICTAPLFEIIRMRGVRT
jgi:hypothetical protein